MTLAKRVAVEVLGHGLLFDPMASASDDFQVLEFVRGKWSPERVARFANQLRRVQSARRNVPHCEVWYMPGDYSAAALAVIDGEKGAKNA